MKSKAYKKGDAYIIETTPDNIEIKVAGGNLRAKNIYGINGTFFDTSTAPVSSVNSCVFIAMNNGKAISGNASINGWNAPPRGTIYFTKDNKLGNKKVKSINDLPKNIVWALGGYTVKPYIDVNEKIPGSINYATSHSYIGYDNKGKVYLIARTDKHRMHQIVPLLNELGITHCVMLDGGGSTQLRHKSISYHQSRAVNTVVALKEL